MTSRGDLATRTGSLPNRPVLPPSPHFPVVVILVKEHVIDLSTPQLREILCINLFILFSASDRPRKPLRSRV